MKRWTRRPEGSNWGDFGADDQLGRINLLTPDKLRQAAAEVREGVRFCLSLPLDLPGGSVLNPRRHPPRLDPTEEAGISIMNFPLHRRAPEFTDVVSDDQVTLCLQYSTQWDSLAHVGGWFDVDGGGTEIKVYYNGYRAGEHVMGRDSHDGEAVAEAGATGARALGIENMAATPIQGRGVFVDLHAHYGRERRVVGYDDLMAVLKKDGVEVEEGDLLVLRTGFAEALVEMDGKPDMTALERCGATLDGRDGRLLDWISERGIAAICADNYAVEEYPARPGEGRHAALPLHEHCLFKLGLPLGELWYLAELGEWLRQAGRYRFMLTAPPLRLPGAVGSPVTPVATV